MVILLTLGCAREADCVDDVDGPTVWASRIDPQIHFGHDVAVDGVVLDAAEIVSVALLFRAETSADWYSAPMGITGGDPVQGYAVHGKIPGHHVFSASLSWYIEAVDIHDNVGCSPSFCDADPNRIIVLGPS